MSSSALMASGSRSTAASDAVAVEDVPASGWAGAVVPVVPTRAGPAFCSSTAEYFGPTDCRLQEINMSGSTTAAAQTVLRNRSGCINHLGPWCQADLGAIGSTGILQGRGQL